MNQAVSAWLVSRIQEHGFYAVGPGKALRHGHDVACVCSSSSPHLGLLFLFQGPEAPGQPPVQGGGLRGLQNGIEMVGFGAGEGASN